MMGDQKGDGEAEGKSALEKEVLNLAKASGVLKSKKKEFLMQA